MRLYQMVVKDVIRRKKRVLYASLGVVIGIATFVAVLTIALAARMNIYSQLEQYGTNLVVMPAISAIDIGLGGLTLGTLAVGENFISEDKLPEVRRMTDDMLRMGLEKLGIENEGNIATFAPKLYMPISVAGTSVMLVGIDPQEEYHLKTWWTVSPGRYLNASNEALAGAVVAELLGLKVDDKIALNGGDVTITGILKKTGSIDDNQIFVPLRTAQTAFNKEGLVSLVELRVPCYACPAEEIATAINEDMPGMRAVAVKQIAATEMGMIEKLSNFLFALAGITLAIGAFGVVNTMMTSVHERIKDIGIMKAVGASRNQIVKTFLYEAIIIGLAGGLFGYVVGTLLAYIVGPLVFTGAAVTYIPQYFPLSLVLATFIAVIAAVYPAFRASKIKIADSFRSL